jgi:hypothetical protein
MYAEESKIDYLIIIEELKCKNSFKANRNCSVLFFKETGKMVCQKNMFEFTFRL